ncbi:MAG: hypothetical protein L3J59_00920 [Methylococcaceae bacterium]|nr:hypothetical protein [Methylococcaceae bacterium]
MVESLNQMHQVANMNEYNPDPAAKKVKYIASIIYLLVFAFLVGGSYINQQQETSTQTNNEDPVVIWPEVN